MDYSTIQASGLTYELGLQIHRANTRYLAGNVMPVRRIHKPDILDLGATFHHGRRTLDLQILDDRDTVTICQNISIGIADFSRCIRIF